MIPYVFLAATVISIVPILIIFKSSLEKIKLDPENRPQITVQFLIGVALSELIPIGLLIYGFTQASPVADMQELMLPGLIIILVTGVANFFIFLQKKVDMEEEVTPAVQLFSLISSSVVNAVPIVSIVALVTMLP